MDLLSLCTEVDFDLRVRQKGRDRSGSWFVVLGTELGAVLCPLSSTRLLPFEEESNS